MGSGDSKTSPFTSVSHSDLERLPEEEIEELREQLQTTLDEHESVPGVTSLGTSETQVRQALAERDEKQEELAEAVRDAAAASGMPSGGIAASDAGSGGGSAPAGSAGGGGGESPSGDQFSADLSAMLEELEGKSAVSPVDDIIPDTEPDDGGDDDEGFDPSPVDPDDLDIDPPDLSGAESRADLANRLFTDSASINPSLRGEDSGGLPSVLVVGEGEDQRVGNLHSFEMPSSDDNRTDLAMTGKEQGRTATQMERVEVEGLDGDYGTERAFVTHYDDLRPDDDTHRPPRKHHAGSEVGVSVFANELGANVPRHAYDPEQNLVASEEFPGDAVRNADRSAIEQVDADNLTDTLAVQLLAGNRDTHSGNIFVDENGETACIDLDIAGDQFRDITAMRRELNMAGAESVSRNGGPSVESAEVMERAQEIAVGLHNAGRLEEVAEKTRQAEAATTGRTAVGDAVEHNTRLLIDKAREDGGGFASS